MGTRRIKKPFQRGGRRAGAGRPADWKVDDVLDVEIAAGNGVVTKTQWLVIGRTSDLFKFMDQRNLAILTVPRRVKRG